MILAINLSKSSSAERIGLKQVLRDQPSAMEVDSEAPVPDVESDNAMTLWTI